MNIVRLAGALTLVIFVPILVWLWRRDLRRDHEPTGRVARVR